MEHVWILTALGTGFVLVNLLLLNRQPGVAPALARSTTRCGRRARTR
jgi:hypothetical protein